MHWWSVGLDVLQGILLRCCLISNAYSTFCHMIYILHCLYKQAVKYSRLNGRDTKTQRANYLFWSIECLPRPLSNTVWKDFTKQYSKVGAANIRLSLLC